MTTHRNSTTLNSLPPPEIIGAAGRLPWQVVNLRELSGIIGADPCQVAMWLYRGKGPPSLPSAWFTSRVRVFRLSAVQTWISGDEEPEWRIWQRTIAETLGEVDLDEAACRARSAELVAMLGEKAICPAGSAWKKGAFHSYAASLVQAADLQRH